jgi:putative phage-type endonuclease
MSAALDYSNFVEWDIPDDTPSPQLIYEDIDQGSDEWLALRSGKITGSRISDMMAKGSGLTRDKYKIQLAVERITGIPVPMSFKSRSMIKGGEDEPLAREYYEFVNDVDTKQVAFVLHPRIHNAGASPDSLVGDDGLLEIKCPDMTTHVNYLLTKKIPGDYMYQILWEMACTGRSWCDWMTYCKEMPIHLRSMIIRVHRNENQIATLEREAERFNEEIEQLIIKLGHKK